MADVYAGKIDQRRLRSIAALGSSTGEDLLGQVVAAYLRDGPRLIGKMRGALAAEEGPAFAEAAHSLAGNSAALGASDLSRLASELEELAAQGALDRCTTSLELLEGEYRQVASELERFSP